MPPLSASQRRALTSTSCSVRFDDPTRVLYATDASIYSVEPAAVAFPRDRKECAAIVCAAAENNLGVTPRGAGTGLAGGALGSDLVIDLSSHLKSISSFNPEAGTIQVGPGVVLDRLNRALANYGLWFGPDVATSSRATLGGMISNNSSGAHAPVYGTTADHVEALEIVLADGSAAWVGAGFSGFEPLRREAEALIMGCSEHIERRLPDDLVKRRPGYDLHRFLRDPGNLAALMAGSEGTLGIVVSAILRVVPRPERRGLGVLFFSSVIEAMQATVELEPLGPAAIEHLDRLVFDQSRGQLNFAAARDFLELDEKPCESLLLVEFFDDVEERLNALSELGIGDRTTICSNSTQQQLVWDLRRAGLSLATGCVGPAKPTTVIEDTCVRPRDLPIYVAGMREILAPLGLEASFYGHAASGLLHVRPTLDLHHAEDIVRLREVADQVSDLVHHFGGSLASEHGVGIARTTYLRDHLGPELTKTTSRVKALFDPHGVMNPGKIVDTGRWRIDRDLRLGPGSELQLPFEPLATFFEKDLSFTGNLEQCNGCGGCRKESPTMCPTFTVTGDELLSTRGRANVLHAALLGRFSGGLSSPELGDALGACLSCKACKRECPSGVDLALLKAETLQARHDATGPSMADRVIAAADGLGRLGSATAPLANAALRWRSFRLVVERVIGLDATRSLPPFTHQRFDRWFRARQRPKTAPRGRVILWDDTWVRYHEPRVGRAAVQVLEAAGFAVVLPKKRRGCGRPAMSRGLLRKAKILGEHNVSVLQHMAQDPVLFLEPSTWSMFVDDYRQLGIEGADEVASRCLLFEDFLLQVLDDDPNALEFKKSHGTAAIHNHCHAKALADPAVFTRLLERVPGLNARSLASGCCGMAGAFGLMQANQELSRAVAEPLIELVKQLPEGARVVSAGTSCRHQLRELAGCEVFHPAEILARALEARPETPSRLQTANEAQSVPS